MTEKKEQNNPNFMISAIDHAIQNQTVVQGANSKMDKLSIPVYS
jgi:hypothetical protein